MELITNYSERIVNLESMLSEVQANLTQAVEYITKMQTGITNSLLSDPSFLPRPCTLHQSITHFFIIEVGCN